MPSFRFSPIQNKEGLFSALTHIHISCHNLCMQSLGTHLPVAGNIGIFSHDNDEYAWLTQVQQELTDSSDRVYNKYFRLHEPVRIPEIQGVPEGIYTYLYIRKPDPDKPHVGDIDFFMEPIRYTGLKQLLLRGKTLNGLRLMPHRPDLDLIELYAPDIDALGYIGAKKFW